jgi:hypothetical protein
VIAIPARSFVLAPVPDARQLIKVRCVVPWRPVGGIGGGCANFVHACEQGIGGRKGIEFG